MARNGRSNVGLIVGAIALVSIVTLAGFVTVAVVVLRKLADEPAVVHSEPVKAAAKAPVIQKTAPQPRAAQKPHVLSIGKEAPEIEGEDIDGNKFKLSDYRGKVVVLDFWGNW